MADSTNLFYIKLYDIIYNLEYWLWQHRVDNRVVSVIPMYIYDLCSFAAVRSWNTFSQIISSHETNKYEF